MTNKQHAAAHARLNRIGAFAFFTCGGMGLSTNAAQLSFSCAAWLVCVVSLLTMRPKP